MARKAKPKAAKRGRQSLSRNPTKVSGTAPPTGGRVLRTNAEIAEWLFRTYEWPRRLAQYEAVAHSVLGEHPDHPDHPRHQVARGVLSLITAAKAARARREPTDWLMATIEHKVNEANKMALLPLAKLGRQFDPSWRPIRPKWDDRLQPLLENLVRDTPTIQAKGLLDALGALAAPQDPKAIIARREALCVSWRPRPNGPERRLSLSALSTRLTWIKAHLADS